MYERGHEMGRTECRSALVDMQRLRQRKLDSRRRGFMGFGKPPKHTIAPRQGSLGVSVTDLTEAQRKELKVKGGVRVETVDGAAAKAGVREGDVILSLDNTEVTSVKQFETLAAKLDK